MSDASVVHPEPGDRVEAWIEAAMDADPYDVDCPLCDQGKRYVGCYKPYGDDGGPHSSRIRRAVSTAAVAAVRADLAAQIEADQYVEDDATWTRAAEHFAALVRGQS